MVCPQFKPIIGGYERSAERLSAELVKMRHSVTVLTERRDMTWPAHELFDGIIIRRFWCHYKPKWHTITSLISLTFFFLFNARRYQVYHVHQYGLHAAISIIFGKILGRPVILKITNTKQDGLLNSLESYSIFIRRAIIFLHKNVDACIALSTDAYDEVLAFGIPKERIYLIGNGVNTTEFSPCSDQNKIANKKLLGVNSEYLILYVGRMIDGKNPLGLLSAWTQIKNEFKNTQLIFIGDGPQLELLQQKTVELGCSDSVRFLGKTKDVASWYQIADMYVLPSKFEGLANALLEAMSCALPIVSTRVSGSTDMFHKGDIGELVNVENNEELANGMRKLLLDDTRRKQCGQSARDVIVKHYSLEAVANSIASAYNKLLTTIVSSR